MSDRRKFLKSAGSTALFTSLGTSFFIACSEAEENIDPDNNNNISEKGFTVDGNVYMIELNHPSFSVLKSIGGWYLFNEGGMLLVNVGQDIIRAFSNSCPHQGTRNAWSYNSNQERFVCSSHNNSYPSDCTTPGTTDDVLECYETNVMGSTLSITKS